MTLRRPWIKAEKASGIGKNLTVHFIWYNREEKENVRFSRFSSIASLNKIEFQYFLWSPFFDLAYLEGLTLILKAWQCFFFPFPLTACFICNSLKLFLSFSPAEYTVLLLFISIFIHWGWLLWLSSLLRVTAIAYFCFSASFLWTDKSLSFATTVI